MDEFEIFDEDYEEFKEFNEFHEPHEGDEFFPAMNGMDVARQLVEKARKLAERSKDEGERARAMEAMEFLQKYMESGAGGE